MWRIKRRRTKPKENKTNTGVIYPKLNATAKPNRYVNRNTYLDVKCNKGAGCTLVGCQCSTDASGNTYCCKTNPYRNPILGYRKHLLDCSGNTDSSGCGYTNGVSGNVYKDNYAKSCATNALACYNPVIKRKQNRNGCVNESYNYSTNQYLTRRCLTFQQQEFNFQSQVPVDEYGTKFRSCANCQITTEKDDSMIIVSSAKASSTAPKNSLIYSTDGKSWVGLGNTVFETESTVVKHNGEIWVAGGHPTLISAPYALAYSHDGKIWAGAGMDPSNVWDVSSTIVLDIAYNSSNWIAVGKNNNSDYQLARSSNGINWTTSGMNTFDLSSGFVPHSIAWGDKKWVLFGNNNINSTQNIRYSTVENGEGLDASWNVAESGFTGAGNYVQKGFYNGSLWVAVGWNNYLSSITWSTNAIAWNLITAPGTYGDFAGKGSDVFYNGKLWVAVGTSAGSNTSMAYSSDGKIWSLIASPTHDIHSVTYGALSGPWVIGSQSNGAAEFYYSDDGITWVATPVGAIKSAGYMDSAIIPGVTPGKCTCSTTGFCLGINQLPCEIKNTKCFAIYKRSNSKFNTQGAVSGGSRINRLKYQTRIVSQGRKVNGRNNVINRRGPAANYMTSRPLTMDASGCWLNKDRTKSGLAQRCIMPS